MEDLTGKDFNGIKVLGLSHKTGSRVYWKLICSCGKTRTPLRSDSLKKHTGKCTCPILKGERQGKLTYIKRTRTAGKRSYCEVLCDCGKVYEVRTDSYQSNISGCGRCVNTYKVFGDVITLDVSTNLYPNTYTKISKEDYSKIKHLKWYTISGPLVKYVQASEGKKRYLLHNYILDCPEDMVTDHQDGDGLNNVRSNIRIVTRKVNGQNVPKLCTNTTGCTGVSLTTKGKYRAYITEDGKQINLGSFENYEEAVSARKAAEKLYGFHNNHGRQQ